MYKGKINQKIEEIKLYYSKDKRGMYILRTMEDISLNGDAYTTIERLLAPRETDYCRCRGGPKEKLER